MAMTEVTYRVPGRGTLVQAGRTVETVTRRVFGHRAIVRVSADRTSPEYGMVLAPAAPKQHPATHIVLATIIHVSSE
jgi:hypothetical protein